MEGFPVPILNHEGILPFKMIGYFEDTKGVIRIVNLSRTDNTMAK